MASLASAEVAPSHIRRFHKDPAPHLSGYGVFHGDDRMPWGEPPPTGTLRRSGSATTGHTSSATTPGAVYHTLVAGPPAAYVIQPTMSLRSLQFGGTNGTLRPSASASKTLPSNRSYGLPSTTYEFPSGTFLSTSGLPPLQYKAWTTEYVDEYRGPKVRKENLETLVRTHGTQDALRATRYQFQGYPHTFKTMSRSSLTERGQVMPNYDSRVKAF